MHRIDVHSHLLPDVDDGCKTVDESIECARMLVAAGYSHCFCTPHLWPSLAGNTRTAIAERTADLQSALETAGLPLRLLPGGELNLHPKVIQTPPQQIVSMALAGKYMLVDMWAEKLPDWFEPAIGWLQEMKLTVILAHPERMRAVQDEPELADVFAEMGILLQGNLQCFADRPTADTRRTAERFLSEGKYFLLGSDTHNPQGLESRLAGLRNAVQLMGEPLVDQLTRDNPRMLLPQQATE
jgi:protein-tyrosine phosphatase